MDTLHASVWLVGFWVWLSGFLLGFGASDHIMRLARYLVRTHQGEIEKKEKGN